MRQASMVLLALTLIVALVACGGGNDTTPSGEPTPRPTFTPTAVGEPATPTARPTDATVIRVVDGDTIEVDIGGMAFEVRYIGIDSPEASDPLGAEATEVNRSLVEHNTVQLVKDTSELDDSDRLLRYVYVGELFVNAEIVRLGYARAVSYPPNVTHDDLLAQMELEARQAGVGLWAE